MLAATYFLAFATLVVCWRNWYRALERSSLGSRLHTCLVISYWLLAGTMAAGCVVSLPILGVLSTESVDRELIALALCLVPQAALLAFVLTPIAIRGRYKEQSFAKALIVMECCVAMTVTIVVVILVLFAAGKWSS